MPLPSLSERSGGPPVRPPAWFAGRVVLAASGYGFSPCLSWDPGEAFALRIPSAPLCGGRFAVVGSRLYFDGFAPATGAELWVFEAP